MFKASTARLLLAPRRSMRFKRYLAVQSHLNADHQTPVALDDGHNLGRRTKPRGDSSIGLKYRRAKLSTDCGKLGRRARAKEADTGTVPPRAAPDPKREAALFASHKAFIEELVGYTFQDDHWLKQALTLDSARQKGDVSQSRMALIGDANLRQVYYTSNCHYMGKKSFCGAFSLLGSNNSLAYCASIWGLGELGSDLGYPKLTSGEGAVRYGTLVEAILGAVFMDSSQNYKDIERAVMRLLSYTEQDRDAGTSLVPDTIVMRPMPARPDKPNKKGRSSLRQLFEDGRRTEVAQTQSVEAVADEVLAGKERAASCRST